MGSSSFATAKMVASLFKLNAKAKRVSKVDVPEITPKDEVQKLLSHVFTPKDKTRHRK